MAHAANTFDATETQKVASAVLDRTPLSLTTEGHTKD